MKVLTFKNETVSVGDAFVSSWGYEQTNVTSYLTEVFRSFEVFGQFVSQSL